MIGETISHYRILEKLGEGGMGVVYIAQDTLLGRRVAIKTLRTAKSAGVSHFRSRFLREARAVSALSHQYIATIYDYGETDDHKPYIVMELINGQTLDALARSGTLTIPRAIEITKQVAEALGEAHRHGIIHRDIKPSNIVINERGIVKVLDFGLAKQVEIESSDPEAHTRLNTQTLEGMVLGTPMYLSPEQALGLEVDPRTDLFSLGAVLYECIAGQPAFPGNSPAEICAKVIRDEPLPPSQLNGDVPKMLDRISLKALAKKLEARYQTVEQLIADLDDALAASRAKAGDRTVTRLMHTQPRPSGALATLSDIFKRPRLSIGYVLAGFFAIAVLVFAFSRLTRATLAPPKPEAQQLYDRGVAALQEGSYFRASKLLERSLAVDNNFALAHARLAEAFAELDYTDKAKDQMLNASRLVTDHSLLDSSSALYFDAISAAVSHDPPGAIRAYTDITKLKPNDASSYVDLGRALEANDQIDQAIAQYSKAAELDHNNPAPRIRLGVLYGRRQDVANSNSAFDQAETLYADNQNFEGSAEVFYQRGYLLAQMSKIPDAQKAAEQSLNLGTTADNKYQQVRALLLLSAVAYTSGKTDEAQRFTARAIELARANGMENLTTQGLLDLANSLLLGRSFSDAERYSTQGLELAQSFGEKRNEARGNLLLGSIYIQQEDANKGKPFIDKALAFYQAGGYRREISRCMVMIGRTQLLKADFDGALKTLDDQLRLAKQVEDPSEIARSQAEVGAALAKEDLYPQAEVRYQESYELNKALGNPLRAVFALVNRGDMLTRLGRYDDARAAMAEVQTYLDSLSDDNRYKQIYGAWSHLYLARMYLSQRNIRDARSECAQAQTIAKPEDNETQAEIEATKGLIEVFAGSAAQGLRLCEHAAARVADSVLQHKASVFLALAEAQLESGNARAAFETAEKTREILGGLHEPEHEWRAWLIESRATERLRKDEALTREQLNHARDILEALGRSWGQASITTYDQRADISLYRKQLEELSSRAAG